MSGKGLPGTGAASGDIEAELARVLDLSSTAIRIRALSGASIVPDSAVTYLVSVGERRLVLQLSPAAFPHVVKEDRGQAERLRQALGAEGGVVVETIATGAIDGRSYALSPFHAPLGSGVLWVIERRRMGSHLLRWLHRIAMKSAEADRHFAESLHAVLRLAQPGSRLGEAAAAASRRLAEGYFRPRTVPMHGDFWKGNVLKAPPASAWPFVVIDWRGARIAGFPIYDLVRMAESLRLSPAQLRAELDRHASTLGCEPEDTRSYLAAAFGHLLLTLDQFPLDRFVELAERSLELHDTAG